MKPGSFAVDFLLAFTGALEAASLAAAFAGAAARLWAARPVRLSHTAPGSAAAFPASMNGFGPRPLAARDSGHGASRGDGAVLLQHGGMTVPRIIVAVLKPLVLGEIQAAGDIVSTHTSLAQACHVRMAYRYKPKRGPYEPQANRPLMRLPLAPRESTTLARGRWGA
jgi:hypothetical protein